MLRKEHRVIVFAVFAALAFWVIDAVVDYLFHYDEPFVRLLVTNQQEVFFRLLFTVCFLTFGLVVSRMFSRQLRTEGVLLREVNERKRAEATLYALSTRDELTGLYNRRGFFTLVEQQFRLASREKKEIFLFFADMDNLKEINDTCGHQEGDRALVEISDILKDTFRESDIIARVGGDEFVAVPVGTTGETLSVIADRVSRNLQVHNMEKARRYVLSISFGIVPYDPERPLSIDELLARGDQMMYEQKKDKRGRQQEASSYAVVRKRPEG